MLILGGGELRHNLFCLTVMGRCKANFWVWNLVQLLTYHSLSYSYYKTWSMPWKIPRVQLWTVKVHVIHQKLNWRASFFIVSEGLTFFPWWTIILDRFLHRRSFLPIWNVPGKWLTCKRTVNITFRTSWTYLGIVFFQKNNMYPSHGSFF